ncbi:hypothetical protein [Actinophytocola sp.]
MRRTRTMAMLTLGVAIIGSYPTIRTYHRGTNWTDRASCLEVS